MPDSFGKRQRREAKQKKANAREERRLARAQRDADRAAGLIEPGTPIGTPEFDGAAEAAAHELAEKARLEDAAG
jgi:hypothetical protein